ncbi:MAG: hypothetical protein K0S33_355 [Bacteroidetes bacterium]|jgi:two-component sensor histidine kinase|nr:hypothetical protein [Bacteroidota bacterium]
MAGIFLPAIFLYFYPVWNNKPDLRISSGSVKTFFSFVFILLHFCLLSQTDSMDYYLKGNERDTFKFVKIYNFADRNVYSDPKLCISTSQRAIQSPKADTSFKGRFWILIGDSHWHLGKLDESLKDYETAAKLFALTHDSSGLSIALKNAGYIHMEYSNLKEALNCYSQAKQIEILTGNMNGLALTNSYVGEIYLRLANFRLARKTYLESVEVFKKLKSNDNIVLGMCNIARTFIEEKQFDSALVWLNRTSVYKAGMSPKTYATVLVNTGVCYYHKKDLVKAEKIFIESEKIFSGMDGDMAVSDIYYFLTLVYTQQKKYEKAESYGEKMLAFSAAVNNYDRFANVYSCLGELYKQTGDYKKATECLSKYILYNDSITNEAKVKIEKDLAEKYESEKKEAKIDLLSAENKLKDSEAENSAKQKNYLLIILGISFLLAIVLFFFFRNKSKIAGELSSKNHIIQNALEEKDFLLKEIHHRVKNNLQIISSLLNLQHGLAGEKNAEEILKICESRIQSMAIIHEKLYQSENFKEISLKDYLDDFIEHLTQSLLLREKNIAVRVHCRDIKLDIDRLVPCSLVLNELITNSVKHGLKNVNQGLISIECTKTASHVQLCVSDDGKGLPADFNFTKYKSLGMRLVSGLVKQIKGEIRLRPTDTGASFEIDFPAA